VDRDDEGLKTARKFERELGVDPKRIIHPKSAVTIEDLFEPEEFQLLLAKLDPSLKMESGETASKAIKRLGIDKILLARKFAESPGSYPKSKPAFERLFQDIENSFKPFSQ
jgi:predicted O-methyltransferase YrrM